MNHPAIPAGFLRPVPTVRSRRPLRLALAPTVLVLAALAVPAAAGAEDGENRWRFSVVGVWDQPTAGTERGNDSGVLEVEGDTGASTGFGLALERRLGGRFGLELGLTRSEPELEIRARPLIAGVPAFTTGAEIETWTTSLGLAVHLTEHRDWDLWLAPRAAWVRYGEFTLPIEGLSLAPRYDSSDDFAYGAQVGFDRPVGRWGFHSSLSWMLAHLDAHETDGDRVQLDLDPLTLAFGVSRRF